MGIRAEHLSYTYGGGTAFAQPALRDVSFDIPDGQFVGLIGHTGSGKSTLIQHLNGLIRATAGKLFVQKKFGEMCLNELPYVAVRPHSTSVSAQDGEKQAEAEGNTADRRDAEQRL